MIQHSRSAKNPSRNIIFWFFKAPINNQNILKNGKKHLNIYAEQLWNHEYVYTSNNRYEKAQFSY